MTSQLSEVQRCARDSDWCDGVICRERGIDCPNAEPAQSSQRAEVEAKLIRRMDRLARDWPSRDYMIASMAGRSACSAPTIG